MVDNRVSSHFPTCWICKKPIEVDEKAVILEYSPISPILAHRVCVENKCRFHISRGSEKADYWQSFLLTDFDGTLRTGKLNKCPFCKKWITNKENYVKIPFGGRKVAVHKSCIKEPGLERWIK